MVTLRLACSIDTWLKDPNLGAGKSSELPVGLNAGTLHRSILKFAAPDWAGLHISKVVSANIQVRNTPGGGVHIARGASPRVKAWRVTENWSEGSATAPSTGNATRWDNMPDRTTSGEGVSGVLAATGGTIVSIPCTNIVKAWAPATVEGGLGKPNYGILLLSYDEAATSRTTEFYSSETTYKPVLVLVVEINTAPEAPINLSPSGDDAIGAIEAGLITYRGERVDPDAGDYVTGAEVAVHADGATDGAPGATIVSGIASFTTQLPTFAVALSSAALAIGTHYRWRGRTKDKGGLWSPWSSFTDGRFIADTVPGAPINLAIDSTSLTPHFFGSINDADPSAALGAVRIVVYQDTTLGAILKWDSGFDTTSGTRFDITYGGSPLEVGMTGLRWAAATRDQYGAEGPLSAYQTWVPAAVTGPDNMTPRTVETKQNSLTPNLTIGHSAAFDAYELELGRFSDGSGLLWDVGVTPHASTSSKVVVYAGTALTWGRTYYWRAKVRVAGTTWTEWSAWYPFYVNALPDVPVGSVDASVDSGDHFTVTTTTATLRFPFSDPDVAKGYTEAPTRREIEIRKQSDHTAFGASPFVITVGITDTYVTGTLVAETVYEARARYDDSANQRTEFSEWIAFKRSVAPVIAAGTAPDVADPNPLIDWTYTSSPGKAQAQFRVEVFDDVTGQRVHDSGFVQSAATEYEVPGDILIDATAYRATVTSYDTDLLTSVLAVTPWTTAFGTPDELTGLVAVADEGSSSVVLTWDATTLNPDYFWQYRIYRLDASGAFALIGTVDAIDVLTFTDGSAPHGTSQYAVTVSNGWAESTPITVTIALALGWWILDPTDPSLRFEVRFVSVPTVNRTYQQETFGPLGRTNPIVVSGNLLSASGSLMVTIVDDLDPFLYANLERAVQVDPYVILKTPHGETRLVKFGSISINDDREASGTRTVTLTYQTVA